MQNVPVMNKTQIQCLRYQSMLKIKHRNPKCLRLGLNLRIQNPKPSVDIKHLTCKFKHSRQIENINLHNDWYKEISLKQGSQIPDLQATCSPKVISCGSPNNIRSIHTSRNFRFSSEIATLMKVLQIPVNNV